MVSKNNIYELFFSENYNREIKEIYKYIALKLNANEAAKSLMMYVKKRILDLEIFPQMYPKIDLGDEFKKKYRKMVIKNYIILYIVDDSKKEVIISHMFYSKRNYFNLI